MFYLSEAFRLFRKSILNHFLTVIITSIAIFVTILSFIVIYGLNKFEKQVKESIEISAFLDIGADSLKLSTIKMDLASNSFVKSIKFVSKEEAAAKFIIETGEDFKGVLDENPLPNAYVIVLKPDLINISNINSVVDGIKRINGINDVVYDMQTVYKLMNILSKVQFVIYPIAFLLIILSIYLVNANNRSHIKNQKNLYRTMSLVGAKEISMKLPIIINGVMTGIVASFICLLVFTICLIILTKVINNFKFGAQIIEFGVLTIVIGATLGLVGSYLSSKGISSKN